MPAPFYPGRDVSGRLDGSNRKGERPPLKLKAHWCANMAAAISHVHRVAHTYHMDIKPGNFVVDGDCNLFLCEWEQSDAPPTTSKEDGSSCRRIRRQSSSQ